MTQPEGPVQPPQQPYPGQAYQPEYPGAAYPPPAGPPGGASPGATAAKLMDRLGDRALRRPEPRFTVTLAGAGVALVIIGILVWGGDYVVGGIEGGGDPSTRKMLGALLAIAAAAAGYAIAAKRKQGPLATAGVVAAALGVPVALAFLTLDLDGESTTPFQLDVVVIFSIAAWVATYLLVPGARGHAFLVGLTTVTFWLYIVEKVEEGIVGFIFFFGWLRGIFDFDGDAFGEDGPSFTTIGWVSLLLGLGYYAAAWAFDRRGRQGVATGLLVGGFAATLTGVFALTDSLKEIGTGFLLILIGSGLAVYGATAARRFTTWTGGVAIVSGVTAIIGKLTEDKAAVGGALLIVAGLLVVLLSELGVGWFGEADDMTPGPSTLRMPVRVTQPPAYGQYGAPQQQAYPQIPPGEYVSQPYEPQHYSAPPPQQQYGAPQQQPYPPAQGGQWQQQPPPPQGGPWQPPNQ